MQIFLDKPRIKWKGRSIISHKHIEEKNKGTLPCEISIKKKKKKEQETLISREYQKLK